MAIPIAVFLDLASWMIRKSLRRKALLFSYGLLLVLLLVIFVGCQTSPPNLKPKPEPKSTEKTRLDTQLLLNNAILEQSNRQENTVWKIRADTITYSEDKEIANISQVVGNLLQDGKIILQISAKRGEVRDNGNVIVLKEDVIASDPRNQSTIESNIVEWRPNENLLLIEDSLKGIHSNLEITAKSGKYFTDRESLEIQGNVIATTDKPALQLTSDRLTWNVAQNQLKSPGAVEIVSFDKDETVTDKLVSDRAEVDLTQNIATLYKNVEFISLQPKLQAATNFLTWNYQKRIGKTDRPIEILARDRQTSLTGNAGEINLQQQIAKLQDGVRGINQQKQSELYARQLTWKIDTEEITATDNVIYEQADPKARLTGEKAVGTLSNNNIVVTSDGKKQVTSVIDN